MQAYRLEVMGPRIRYGDVAGIGQEDRRSARREERKELEPRLHLRRVREQPVEILGPKRLHVSDLALAQSGEIRRIESNFLNLDVVVGQSLLLYALSRAAIVILRTIRSGSGRAKSIDSKPFERSAPVTSMPSARRNVRWNCRAAIPRCRKCRALSSA